VCVCVYVCVYMSCDEFAEDIVGRQPSGHVLAHAARNSTVEVVTQHNGSDHVIPLLTQQ
jgi:hypothetical protein